MKLQPGTEVTPNVRLEKLIAHGAMGDVWLAEHLTLATKVAVKFISDRVDPDDPVVLERFVREASTAAQIKSSHVVQTFDQGVTRDGQPYIVMEFLEGEELGQRLTREKRLGVRDVVTIVSQVAKALHSAHKLHIIHRDMKPDNIFLSTRDDELHVKIFDFGIAKRRFHAAPDAPSPDVGKAQIGLTNAGVLVGTPEYMSPEQVIDASAVDHRSDLWGLAVIAYVCLTGELPFRSKDVGELCVQLLEAQFEPPTKVRPELAPDLDAFFAKALARKPAERYQTAREMAQALAKAGGATLLPTEGSHPGIDPAALAAGEAAGWGRVSWSAGRRSDPEARGMHAPTFSGSAADAELGLRRRWSTSTIGGALAVLAMGGAVIAFLVSGGGSAPVAPASTAATEPTVSPAALPTEPAEVAPAEPAAPASQRAEDGDAGAATPRGKSRATGFGGRPRLPPPTTKDPGF
jgi:eukaryotic-like serine/threonine-protein kinase